MNLGNKLAIAFASVSVCILAVCLFIVSGQDQEPPVITFANNDVIYTDGMDMEQLLMGVEAVDASDGDVTDRIVIEKITKTSSGRSVIVTYAAGDKSNNFSKSSRIFRANTINSDSNRSDSKSTYQLEAGEAAATDVPVVVQTEESRENQQRTEAKGNSDDTLADAENNQEAQRENTLNQEAGVEVQQSAVPVLQLNTAETILKKGTFFNINDYIAQLSDDVDTTEALQHRIRTNGEFDNNTPGDYQVSVMVTDSEGNVSPAQNLTIHVVD